MGNASGILCLGVGGWRVRRMQELLYEWSGGGYEHAHVRRRHAHWLQVVNVLPQQWR